MAAAAAGSGLESIEFEDTWVTLTQISVSNVRPEAAKKKNTFSGNIAKCSPLSLDWSDSEEEEDESVMLKASHTVKVDNIPSDFDKVSP